MSFALKSGYGDTEDDDLYSAFDWSDWLWNEAFDYEYRQREKGNGQWEYQYRYPAQENLQAPDYSEMADQTSAEKGTSNPIFQQQLVPSALASSSYSPYSNITFQYPHSDEQPFSPDFTLSSNVPSSPVQVALNSQSTRYEYNIDSPRSEECDSAAFTVENLTLSLGRVNAVDNYHTTHNRRDFKVSSDYVSIVNPKGYFKPGRIFRAEPPTAGREARVSVVVSDRPLAAVCISPIDDATSQDHKAESYPVIVENTSIPISPTLQLDFSRLYLVDHNAKVLNIGRIDRKSIKNLRASFSGAMDKSNTAGGTFENAKDGAITTFTPSTASKLPNYPLFPYVRDERVFYKPTHDLIRRTNQSRVITSNNLTTKKEPLHSDFQVRSSYDFKRGKVLKVLWSEPRGRRWDPMDEYDDWFSGASENEEQSYNSIRRFVIVKEGHGHSVCIPIYTYQGQGTLKPGVNASDHAIIYTGNVAPKPLEGEKLSGKRPIRMVPYTPLDSLKITSRLNYAKIYTIEHNLKVCFIGKIHKESEPQFFVDFERTFSG